MPWRIFDQITQDQATIITEQSGDQVLTIPFSWLDENFSYLKDRIYTGSGSPSGVITPQQDKAWYLDLSTNMLWFWDGSIWIQIEPKLHASKHQPGGSDSLPTGAPVDLGENLSEGTSTSFSRSDHVHKLLVRVSKGGVDTGTRKKINFLEGSGITIATTDDATNDKVDVQISTTTLGAYARAYRGTSNQTIPANAWSKVWINASSFASYITVDTTNNRLIPQKAGYYRVHVSLRANCGAPYWVKVALYKNGALYSEGTYILNYSTGAIDISLQASDLIYFNGSTDYVEVYVYGNIAFTIYYGASLSYISMEGPF